MYVEKFPYPKVIKESTTNSNRVYFIEHENKIYQGLYSVTTIMSKMTDTKDAINEWKKKIGHEKADEIINKSVNIGNFMHDILYYRLIGTKDYVKNFKPNFIFKLASKMADEIQKVGLDKHLDEIWGCEVPLFVPDHYAGRTDCVGVYRGTQSIIDFKNSYKEKKEEFMENYFLQAAAYAVAHDYLFGTDIKQCVILIANSSDTSAREIIRDGKEFQDYKLKWLDMVERFCNK